MVQFSGQWSAVEISELGIRPDAKGLDVGREPFIKSRGTAHCCIEPDNYYSIARKFGPGSLDFISSADLISATKYHRILLKEWFYAVRKGGKIIIALHPEKSFDEAFLLSEIKKVLKDGVSTAIVNKGGWSVFILTKKCSSRRPQDTIDRWTFGIITNGKRPELMEKIFESIKSQKIPRFEIIVCGTYFRRKGIRYIPFSEKDDLGWITRKKNIICGAAKYENIAILHDRVALGKNWFKGVKKYGNDFEIFLCPQYYNGGLLNSWSTTAYPFSDPRCMVVYPIEHADWDPWVTTGGSATFIKKSVWKQVPWDETLFWNQNEDLRQGHHAFQKGVVVRFNPWARLISLSPPRGKKIPVIVKKDPKKLGRLTGDPFTVLKKTSYQKWLNIKYAVIKKLNP